MLTLKEELHHREFLHVGWKVHSELETNFRLIQNRVNEPSFSLRHRLCTHDQQKNNDVL